MTPDEVLSLPVVVDLASAGRCFGLPRSTTHDAVRRGEFPVPVLRLGHRMMVTRAALLTALGIEDAGPEKSEAGPIPGPAAATIPDTENPQATGVPDGVRVRHLRPAG